MDSSSVKGKSLLQLIKENLHTHETFFTLDYLSWDQVNELTNFFHEAIVPDMKNKPRDYKVHKGKKYLMGVMIITYHIISVAPIVVQMCLYICIFVDMMIITKVI